MNVPTGQTPADDLDRRPGLAMIANCMTPYRAHLHALLAAGIPEFKLHTLITHGPAEFDWAMQIPNSIHATYYENPGDSPLQWLPRAPVREWQKGARLIDYLNANDVRAVICAGYQYLSYQRLIRNCHRRGIPLFAHNDSNIRSERRLSTHAKWLKRRVYSLWIPKVVGAMSMGELGDQFYRNYGISPERIYRMPCTPDYERYAHVDPKDLQGFRDKHALSADRHQILFSGRLVDVKRVDLLIDAFASLADERPDWDLLIVGDGMLRDELMRRVPTNLKPRVVWTGFLEQSESIAAYHAADVLVLPSDYEPWALVIQEAMAAGLAIVASDVVGAAHDLVVDGRSGRIFPAGDVAGLRNAILDVTDPRRLGEYRRNSRAALDDWRERVDPVREVRRALSDQHLL